MTLFSFRALDSVEASPILQEDGTSHNIIHNILQLSAIEPREEVLEKIGGLDYEGLTSGQDYLVEMLVRGSIRRILELLSLLMTEFSTCQLKYN